MSIFSKEDKAETMQREMLNREDKVFNTKMADQLDDQVFLKQQEENRDLVRWQQSLADEIEELKHDLKREVWTGDKWEPDKVLIGYKETGEEVYEKLPPLMNDTGIKMVESAMRPLLSRNLINSNLNENMVYGMLRRTSDTIVNNITTYGEQYQMEFGNYSHVTRLIKNFMIPTPFRALNDGERKHLRTMNKRLESYGESQQEAGKQKKKWW